jgi:hypothetical protein
MTGTVTTVPTEMSDAATKLPKAEVTDIVVLPNFSYFCSGAPPP